MGSERCDIVRIGNTAQRGFIVHCKVHNWTSAKVYDSEDEQNVIRRHKQSVTPPPPPRAVIRPYTRRKRRRSATA